MRILSKESAKKGLTAKFDRKNRFSIRKTLSNTGMYQYFFANTALNEELIIPHFLFDRFRINLMEIKHILEEASIINKDIDTRLFFKEQQYYRFKYSTHTLNQIVISDLSKPKHLHIDKEAINVVIELLYHQKLKHANGTFDRIINYHGLFQFTFNEGSESISSGLTLRKNILTHIEDYIPLENRRDVLSNIISTVKPENVELKGIAPNGNKKTTKKNSTFRSKLGERSGQDNYTVDYDSLFDANQKGTAREVSPTLPRTMLTAESNCFGIPLLASDIKASNTSIFKCELSQEEASTFRDSFLGDRDSVIMLGFEIFSAVFKHGGKLKSFRFPLYFMNVKIDESGRNLHIHPPKDGDIYLNHLGLAAFVERFAKDNKDEAMDKFFHNFSSQKIEVDKELHTIRIHRQLPYSDEVFTQTREILIGKQGENGHGGLLENLNVLGIECDLESVYLYKTPRNPSPLVRSLEQDLVRTQEISQDNPERFYRSLLGQFFNPERHKEDRQLNKFCETTYFPGAIPRATKKLINNLNEHNLVLLEGPPGTGKTFTILNLLIHCINNKQRLLIVSDQKAAIHALTEKLEEYLIGNDRNSPLSKRNMNLLKGALKVIDEVPDPSDSLNQWVSKVIKLLQLEQTRDFDGAEEYKTVVDRIAKIDKDIASRKEMIKNNLSELWPGDSKLKTSPKHFHPTTVDDINSLIQYIEFIGSGEHSKVNKVKNYDRQRSITKTFIENRSEMSADKLGGCYSDFKIDVSNDARIMDFINSHISLLSSLLTQKPKSEQEFKPLFKDSIDSATMRYLYQQFKTIFTEDLPIHKKLTYRISHPCIPLWKKLEKFWHDQKELYDMLIDHPHREGILRQYQEIHEALDPDETFKNQSTALEVSHFSIAYNDTPQTILETLLELQKLQAKRDDECRKLLISRLAEINDHVLLTKQGKGPSPTTAIANTLDALKECSSIDTGTGVPLVKELQENLAQHYPIWICRKQAVSFLFSTQEELFDLVIVDEAGQCRVDDAMPLLFRAKKLMVVGDDKQTVMDKNSIIDDFLFKDFELDEHLRTLQARGVKGGGSNLFSMVKSIKQGGVLLDEHYRCPPSIISYSNEYVYNSDLKIMQWQPPGAPPSVVVDYSESEVQVSSKPTSGKFKGIETDMIDRFFDFIGKTIVNIEKETDEKINFETDVAICYFLLKNEPYIKEKKSLFLQKMKRGNDVLDGAGAALQGKERKYIFYLWDINRYNLSFFKQGDDPDKRKGELNVLMSRPKVRAYHYLHKSFASLKHDQATISDYLWKTYQRQSEKKEKKIWTPRTKKPDPRKLSWQRSSGQAIHGLLQFLWESRHCQLQDSYQPHYSVVLGDPRQKIDLILIPKQQENQKSIAIVDLSEFADRKNPEEDIIDYFFQLQRAVPSLDPVFAFIHELADERYLPYRLIEEKVQKFKKSPAA